MWICSSSYTRPRTRTCKQGQWDWIPPEMGAAAPQTRGEGGDWPWISISVILPTYTISQGRACPTSVCAMRACGNTDCSSVAVLRVKKRGLYIDMSMYGVFDTSPPTFQSTPSLLPRLLRRTTPLRTLVSCVFNRLRLTLPSTTACKVHQHKRVTYIML